LKHGWILLSLFLKYLTTAEYLIISIPPGSLTLTHDNFVYIGVKFYRGILGEVLFVDDNSDMPR